jgi:hypothetical protein
LALLPDTRQFLTNDQDTSLRSTKPTVPPTKPRSNGVKRLEEAGILREVTGRRRGRLYVYEEYLKLLNEGTVEPGNS